MEQENKPVYWPQEREIPKEFYSLDLEAPFKTCCQCDKDLVASKEFYLIERCFKRVNPSYENVIFEYAICRECTEEMNQSLSKESMMAMQLYFLEYFRGEKWVERLNRLETDERAWYKQCMIKGTPREELSEYNLCGLFMEDKMLLGEFPYIIGEEAMEEMVNLLSAETKDELDDFRDNVIGTPPEFGELLKGRPIFVG